MEVHGLVPLPLVLSECFYRGILTQVNKLNTKNCQKLDKLFVFILGCPHEQPQL